jgi:predicted GIY-YIG superfamily endonuclease
MSKTAISREKQIKKWNRVWKMGLIERTALSGKISAEVMQVSGSPLSRE